MYTKLYMHVVLIISYNTVCKKIKHTSYTLITLIYNSIYTYALLSGTILAHFFR